MGRKKKDATHEPRPEKPARAQPAAAVNGGDQDSLAEVVRKALNGVGAEADNETVKGWIARNYPGRAFNPSTLNTTISGQRARIGCPGDGLASGHTVLAGWPAFLSSAAVRTGRAGRGLG